MTRLNWNETDLSFTLVAPSSNFSGTNTIGGQITPGSQGGHYAQPFVIPSVFAVWNASPDLKLGIAITAPFGARLAYSQVFVGRYQSVVSNLSDVQVSLTGAYRINEHLSVGGGPLINFLSIRLTQAVNLGGLSSAFGDPIADFNGGSVGAGFALGALYEFMICPRRNSLPIPHPPHRHGHAASRILPIIGVASPAIGAALSASAGSASSRFSLPDSFSLGFYKQIDQQWSVMADLQWTDWSLVDTLAIIPANQAPATVLPENWRNTWFGAIGASFRPIKNLLLQAGIGYDLSPVTDDNRTTRIPHANRFLVGGGITYSLLTNVNVQFAVLQAFSGAAKIDSSASPTAGVIQGTYHTQATTFSVGMTARF